MIITLSGLPCSGKTSVAMRLAKHYNYTHFSAGDMRRKAAKKRGLTIEEYNALDEDTDTEVEDYLQELGKTQDNVVIDGRMCAYAIPNGFNIFLTAREEKQIERCMKKNPHHERIAEEVQTPEQALHSIRERMKSDAKRYNEHYDFDYLDKKNYSYVLDTSDITEDEVIATLISEIDKRNL